MKICIVVANYYPKISNELLIGSNNVLKKNGVKHYKIIFSPGVFEIPIIIAKKLSIMMPLLLLDVLLRGRLLILNLYLVVQLMQS